MARPRATYRLQLQPAFGFDDAADLADYLARLGVSHLYASPYLQAAPGSTHGYDVIDHSRVNEELGGTEGHDRMCRAMGEAGLGQVLDIVPNHMAVVKGNAWWWDVLENGPSSLYASYFDVDWDPPEAKLRNRVLMAILGDHYGRALEAGQLLLGRDGGSFTVGYFDHVLPIAPRSLDDLLLSASKRCASVELESLAAAFGRLPPSWATDLESVRERHRDKEVLRARLAELCQAEPEVAEAVDAEVAEINADPDALDALLERQNYRLAHWRTAGWELDYRRFFDIHTLAALRVENDHVFYDTHRLVLDWLAQGVIDGLRIDHPDGLRDPEGYLRRLAGEAPPGTFVVVEKILEPGEELAPSWPVAGTTGYDFCNRATGLFVDPAGEDSLTRAYTAFTKEPAEWTEVVWEKKHLVMREVLSSEVERLTALAVRVCEGHRRYRDYTRHDLHEVITELIAAFPVYRTYVVAGTPPSPADTAHVMTALQATKARRPDLDAELCDFLGELVLGRHRGQAEDELVARFQQLTGPVMAKGVEDTAFYTYNRLVALNEVGGDPGRFGTSVEEFHRTNAGTASAWPETLLATSTHDTKRSEDVRARIALLSEIPEDFAEAVARWSSLNKAHRSPTLRDRNMEWLLYQTLVGAWPLPLERARAYAEKAAKEAKVHTSWVDPNPAYDRSVRIFVERLYGNEEFQADLGAFAASLVTPGRINSLAQTALRLTCPGVPDTYQGTELWDLSLVDPDNRRPVDWELRRRLLDEAEQLSPAQAWARLDEGLPKLLLIQRALRLRWRRLQCFAGSYEPLRAEGQRAPHLVAFARGGEVLTAVPRLVMGLGGDWADTTLSLPPGRWADVLDGGERIFEDAVPVADLLAPFPVAILERVG
jgi:(1->4)-alpha-D-glucan 1-alpha-D-glucosylmutase